MLVMLEDGGGQTGYNLKTECVYGLNVDMEERDFLAWATECMILFPERGYLGEGSGFV